MLLATIADDLWTMGVPVFEKGIRTVAVYAGVLVLLRLAGKRELAQLNSFDFVVLLLLSNVVQNAIIGPDNSLAGGLFGAAILVGVNTALVRLVGRDDRALRVMAGAPSTLVSNGILDRDQVARLGLRPADVIGAVRRQGASTLEEVAEAALEPGGAISVRLRKDAENATKADVARLEAKLDRLLSIVRE